MKLEALVAKYRAEDGPRLQKRLNYFHGLKSFSMVIEHAALAKEPDWSEYEKHPHQWRLEEANLETVAKELLRHASKLRACRSFDDVFQIVEGARVPKFGDLAVYDTALRIAAKLGHRPTKVYLHAGTRDGCKALGLPFREKTLDPQVFQRPIQALRPHEIEDFVCIYKDDFGSGPSSRTLAHDRSGRRSKSKTRTFCSGDAEAARTSSRRC